ncbi:hypothetical protein ACN42_g11659 [Penicillium freii]|uniref:Uncharacterized protein n=1 Tax=Penicillium freii TaxID=48697 RepID=A0A117NK60_PENFR|nr:hypothetical protein ACN42_g11659 [Penicillium freii]
MLLYTSSETIFVLANITALNKPNYSHLLPYLQVSQPEFPIDLPWRMNLVIIHFKFSINNRTMTVANDLVPIHLYKHSLHL